MGAEGTDVLDSPEAGRTAVRGSLLRAGAYVVGVLLTVISAPLLIRHLGISEFGRYTAVVSVVTIIAGVTEGGLNTIALRDLVTLGPDTRDRLMANLLGVRLVLAIAGVFVAVLFSAVAGYGTALVIGTALAGVGMVLQVTQSLFSTSLQSELRFGWAAVADTVRQVATVTLIIGLVIAGAQVVPFLAIPIPASFAALVVTIVLVRGRIPMRPRLERRVAWPVLKDTLPYTASVAVNVVYFRVAILVMSIIATAEQTGYFATSFRVVEILVAVPGLALGAAFPILARARRDDAERFGYATRRVFEVLGVISGTLVALGVILGAPLIIKILAGDQGHPAIAVLRIQGLAVAATWIANAASFPLLSLRRHRALLITNLIALATTVVLTLSLVPGLEAKGAAIATVTAEAALAASTTWLLVRAAPEVRLPLGVVPIALGSAAVAAAPAFALGLPSVPAVILGCAIFLALLGLLGRFPPEVGELPGHPARGEGGMSAPRVDAVVLTYDGLALLDGILSSLAAQTYPGVRVTVVDNGSSDGTPEHLAERWPDVRVVRLPENAGVPVALNRGIAASDAPFVALFNNDLELEPDFIERLVVALEAHPEAGTATGKLLRHDDRGTIDAAGDGLLWSGAGINRGALEPDRGQWDEAGWTFAACAGAALYRRSSFERVGTFDERFFAYQEDVDWSLRAQLVGLGARDEPTAVGYHMGGATTRKRKGYYGRLQRRNQVLVIAKGFPARALLRHLPVIVAHQVLWFAASVRDGAGRDHLSAWLEALRMLPGVLRDRRRIQRGRTADTARLDALVRRAVASDVGPLGRLGFALAPEVMRDRRVARLRGEASR